MSGMTYQILFLEDNWRDAELIAYQLENDNISFEMTRVETREDFICEIHNSYDIILADYTLPQFDALEGLRILQDADIHTPLIIITGTISEEIAVQCMREGAADYLLKDRMARLGRAIEQAFKNKQLKELDQEQRRLTRLLRETAIALASHLDISEIIDIAMAYVQNVVPVAGAAIWLIRNSHLEFIQGTGFTDSQLHILENLDVNMDNKNIQPLLNTRTLFTLDALVLAENRAEFDKFEFYAAMPIRTDSQLYGFILLSAYDVNPFETFHNEAIEIFSYQVTVALENAKLYSIVVQDAIDLERRVKDRTAELQIAKDRVEKILNSTSDAVLSLSQFGRIEQANPAFMTMFGIDNNDIFGQFIFDYIDEQAEELFTTAIEHLNQGLTFRSNAPVRRADGTTFEADIVFSPLMSDFMLGIVCSIRDVTMQRRVESELRNALERERELNELKTRFISMVSHEYRTPLAVIQSSSSILQEYWELLSPEQRIEHLTRMDRQVVQMTALMDEVLNISKTDGALNTYQFESLNISEFCQEMVKQFNEISKHDLELEITNGECIFADVEETMFRLAVRNLITNAIKYSDEGSRVCLKLESVSDTFVLSVIDDGIGIPEADIPYLFDVFHRGSNVNQIDGTGLGLAIVKQAVEAHGGAIQIQSELYAGTTFTIKLPINQVVASIT